MKPNQSSQYLTVKEYGELDTEKHGISTSVAERLLALADREKSRLKVPNILTRAGKTTIKAGQVVGVLSVPGLTTEILPKIQGEDNDIRSALIRMLAVAYQLPIAVSSEAAMSMQRWDLLEIIIQSFVERLITEVRRGLAHRYQSLDDDLTLMRGKLNLPRQIRLSLTQANRLACTFDELTNDTPLNRVLKATVLMLLSLARSSVNHRKLNELVARLDHVGDSTDPLSEAVLLDRTNRTYHEIYHLAQMLLSRNWQNTTHGREDGIALLFAMNDLFEMFIGRCLQTVLGSHTVRLQAQSEYALHDQNHAKYFNLKPDIVIGGDLVVDTKWKQLEPDDDKLGVSQGDVYQMLAYGQAYKAKRLVLLYPWHERLSASGILRRWWVSGRDTSFDIAAVDVSKPNDVPQALGDIVNEKT